MRGRTNLLGFNEDFINAYIDQYEVKPGNSITAGDFVELFSQTDAMTIMSGTGIELRGKVDLDNNYFLVLFSTSTANSYVFGSYGLFENLAGKGGLYLFKKNANNTISYIDQIALPTCSGSYEGNNITGIVYDGAYLYIANAASSTNNNILVDTKQLSVYKIDYVNEQVNLIGQTSFNGGYINKFLKQGILISTNITRKGAQQSSALSGYSYYLSVIQVQVNEGTGTVTVSTIYEDPDKEQHGTKYAGERMTAVALNDSKTRFATICYMSDDVSSGYAYTRQKYVFDFDRTTNTVTKRGSAPNSYYNLGMYDFIDDRYLLDIYNYLNHPTYKVIDTDTLDYVSDAVTDNDFTYNTQSSTTSYARNSAFRNFCKIGNALIIGTDGVYKNGVYIFKFVEVEFDTNNQTIEVTFNEYSVDFDYSGPSSGAEQKLIDRLSRGIVEVKGTKYFYVFLTFTEDAYTPHNLLYNELDVSALPYVEMTSDIPKKVAGYSGKISGVARTSGNAGELIDVYVPY